jgi:hypothetical protein
MPLRHGRVTTAAQVQCRDERGRTGTNSGQNGDKQGTERGQKSEKSVPSHSIHKKSSGNAYYPTQTVQKELAAAVLENGGLEDVDLKVLCDEYPLLFGLPSTKKRRGVGGKVRDWKSKPHTFERFLRCNGTSNLLLSAVGNT